MEHKRIITAKICEEQFETLCNLTGRDLQTDQQAMDFFHRLKKYDARDLEKACNDDDMIEQISRFGFNWPAIKKYVVCYKIARKSAEEEGKRHQEMSEFRQGKGKSVKSKEFQDMVDMVKSL